MHVSQNRLEGSLSDTSLGRLLDSCRDHAVTGTIQITGAGGALGIVELRAGAVDEASFAGLTGGRALERMRSLGDGMYELTQRLPDLTGALGDAAEARGEVGEVSLVELMRHCEDNALTCTITVVHDFDRGQIRYRAGEIVEVEFNGVTDDDKIVDLVRLENARFRIAAPPLDFAIEGWPSVRSDRTEPFHIGHLRRRPRATPPPPLPGVTERPSRTALVAAPRPRREPPPGGERASSGDGAPGRLRRAVARRLRQLRAGIEHWIGVLDDAPTTASPAAEPPPAEPGIVSRWAALLRRVFAR